MKRTVCIMIIGLMALSMIPAAKAQLFADLPRTDQIKAAQSAELKGDIARARENYWGAATEYRKALKASPKNAKLYNKLGIAYLQARNYGVARKAFSQAVKYEPNYVNALNNLGAANCLDKKYKQAIRYLKQALALEETNASAHLNMAESWAGLGQMDRAMTEYARALELNADILSGTPGGVLVNVNTPEQRARVNYLIAKAYAKRGNLEGALEYLQRAKDYHYTELAKVYEDPTFTNLWGDPRLQQIVKR